LLPFAFALVGLGNANAQGVHGQGTWETTLLGRDINLNPVAATDVSAVYLYDKTLNVTWLRNANANGRMNWGTAMSWAANLVTGSGGNAISDWRLPTMADPAAPCNWSNSGTNCGTNVATSSSEMANLFFSTLGNKSIYDTNGNSQAGYGLTNVGSFQNMQNLDYWFGTDYTPSTNDAWGLNTGSGSQGNYAKGGQIYAMAVRPGDVAPVPEPESYAMLLAGLGLIGVVSRRRATKPSTRLDFQ
jgi:hypothetical protein